MQMRNNLKIQDFNQISVLGRGSYANVVLVKKNDNSDNIYAMKILKKNFIEKKNQETNVMRERDILASVNNQFIVKLYNTFQDQKQLYFVLEYCQGGEFFGLLGRAGRLTEQQAKFYAAQIIQALDYLHSKNIIYRDLKPQNILVDSTGYLKLTDFGLSKPNVTEDNAMSISGTPEYLAPEIICRGGHGKPVDWWCLGNVIYEMVVGLPPFYCENRGQLFQKIKYASPVFPQTMSPELKNMLALLLQKNPQKRLGTKGSGDQIKNHPWFANFDWKSLLSRTIKSPYIPKITNQIDVSNFDEQFTSCKVQNLSRPTLDSQYGKQFFNFSYQNRRQIPSTQMEYQNYAEFDMENNKYNLSSEMAD